LGKRWLHFLKNVIKKRTYRLRGNDEEDSALHPPAATDTVGIGGETKWPFCSVVLLCFCYTVRKKEKHRNLQENSEREETRAVPPPPPPPPPAVTALRSILLL